MRQRQAAAGASWCTFLATHLYLNLRRRSHAHHPLAATGATRIRAYSRRESESGGGDTLPLFVLVATSFSRSLVLPRTSSTDLLAFRSSSLPSPLCSGDTLISHYLAAVGYLARADFFTVTQVANLVPLVLSSMYPS